MAAGLRKAHWCAETSAVRDSWKPIFGNQVQHIPYGIEPLGKLPDQVESRKAMNVPQDQTVFLIYGTHRKGKDLHTCIQAAKNSPGKPHLLFVGPVISGESPQELLKKFDYSNATIIPTFVDSSEARKAFAACDAVLLPYPQGYIKGSTVLIEAPQNRRPVIASDTGHLA